MMFTTAISTLAALSSLLTAASAVRPQVPKQVLDLPQEVWCPQWNGQPKLAVSSREFSKTILTNVERVVKQETQRGGSPHVLSQTDRTIFEIPDEILRGGGNNIQWAPHMSSSADYDVNVLWTHDEARGTVRYVGATLCVPDDDGGAAGPSDAYREKCHFCWPRDQQGGN